MQYVEVEVRKMKDLSVMDMFDILTLLDRYIVAEKEFILMCRFRNKEMVTIADHSCYISWKYSCVKKRIH